MRNTSQRVTYQLYNTVNFQKEGKLYSCPDTARKVAFELNYIIGTEKFSVLNVSNNNELSDKQCKIRATKREYNRLNKTFDTDSRDIVTVCSDGVWIRKTLSGLDNLRWGWESWEKTTIGSKDYDRAMRAWVFQEDEIIRKHNLSVA